VLDGVRSIRGVALGVSKVQGMAGRFLDLDLDIRARRA